MAFRASSTNTTLATTMVVTKPTGTVDDDIMLVVLNGPINFTVTTVPSGWTELTGSPKGGNDYGSEGARVYYKKAASEGASWSWTCGSQVIAAALSWSGRDTTSYLHKSSATVSNGATPWTATSANYASNTTVECDIAFLVVEGLAAGAPLSHTTPSGYTKQVEISNVLSGNKAITCYYKDAQASGFNGGVSEVGTSATEGADWSAFSVALAIAGGGGTTGALVTEGRAIRSLAIAGRALLQ